MARRLRWAWRGSSPPTRGTLGSRPGGGGHRRFIPAYAGNTSPSRAIRRRAPVHPRLRGEHASTPDPAPLAAGSSPPTRGTQFQAALGGGDGRFIPAYAGNTVATVAPSRPPTVHPRLRGEHRKNDFRYAPLIGSSPPTRGTREEKRQVKMGDRFIPAYAGNTIGRSR